MGYMKLNVDVKSIEKTRTGENKRGNVNADEKQCDLAQGHKVDDCITDSASVNKKRKCEYHLDMLKWICKVAKDPCNHAIEHLPDKSRWRYYGREQPWKKVLLARERMLLKKNAGRSSEPSVWQKKQKMHPSMYEDDQSDYDSTDFLSNHCRERLVPIGISFQVDLPEFCGVDYRGDSKWLGSKIWPLEKGEFNRSLIERDPIGKGRQEHCGCQFPGSPECVRFHVWAKRMKLRLELGPAFALWKFDGMGEDVALSWTRVDENLFQAIVKSNRLSSEKYFWDELLKFFPNKGREALVSYYFNVLILRRRSQQNRSPTMAVNSDDEK